MVSIIGNTIIAIVVGSVYYNLGEDTDALEKRAVLVFFSLMINAYAPAFEVNISLKPLMQASLTRYGDYGYVGPATNRRKALSIRPLPSLYRELCFSHLRSAKQARDLYHVQHHPLLHDQPTQNRRRLLHLSCLYPYHYIDHVDVLSNGGIAFQDYRADHGTCFYGNPHLQRVYWLHYPNQGYGSLAELVATA